MTASPYWLHREASIETQSAAKLWETAGRVTEGGSHEILFGRVQEDTSLEASYARGARALCIASGGETAFDLLLGGAKDVIAIDINPAQVLLVHLKAALFRNLPPEAIDTAFLHDARPAFARLRQNLPPEVNDYFQAHPEALAGGLVHAGRIDRSLTLGMKLLQTFFVPRRRIERLLSQPNLQEQQQAYREHAKSLRSRLGLKLGFHPLVLRRIFGSQLGSLAPAEFGDKVRRDFETVFTTVPAWDNPYLWQTMLGRYPEQGMPGWLTPFGHSRMRQVISRLGLETGDVAEWLLARDEPTLDLVCLSNVTDMAGDDEKRRLIDGFAEALKPGGRVVARSLFDTPIGLDRLSDGTLQREPIEGWTDRSMICRNVEVYRWSPR